MVQKEQRLNTEGAGAGPYMPGPAPVEPRPSPDQLGLKPLEAPEQGSGPDDESEVQFGGGVYVISVAARLLEMHPQTLRKYERLGLIRPSRTVGMLRLYSNEDLEKLRLIRYLQENLGMNLAGVEFILNLLDNLLEMQRRVSHQAQVSAMRAIMEEEMRRLFQQLDLPFQR